MDCKPEWRRRTGRSKLRWIDGVLEDIKKLGVKNLLLGIGKPGKRSFGKPRPTLGCRATDDDKTLWALSRWAGRAARMGGAVYRYNLWSAELKATGYLRGEIRIAGYYLKCFLEKVISRCGVEPVSWGHIWTVGFSEHLDQLIDCQLREGKYCYNLINIWRLWLKPA